MSSEPLSLTNAERIAMIRGFPVRDIVAPPGHRQLRDPAAMLDMASRIAVGWFDRPAEEPIVLNLFPAAVTDGSPAAWTVHCIDGTHRLAAGLHAARWNVVGDLPSQMLVVWIEGWAAGDRSGPRPRWIPLEVAEASSISDWTDVSGHPKARGSTAQVRGDLANDSMRIPARHRGVRLATVLAAIPSPGE